MRASVELLLLALCGACRIDEYIAPPPGAGDADGGGVGVDGATSDGGEPDAPEGPHGLHAMLGARPEFTGSCGALDDRAELESQFAAPQQEQDCVAGWEFDTAADNPADASYGMDPAWSEEPASERFSLRFRGTITLDPGPHCFSIDIGATGTDIINGRNGCGQLWVGPGDTALAETGYEAATAGPATGCLTLGEGGGTVDLDIVFWYFNIFEQAKLVVRTCAGEDCTPDEPLSVSRLAPT